MRFVLGELIFDSDAVDFWGNTCSLQKFPEVVVNFFGVDGEQVALNLPHVVIVEELVFEGDEEFFFRSIPIDTNIGA